MPRKLTLDDIRNAIVNSIPIVVKTYAMTHESEIYIEKILERFLEELGHSDILNPLAYCLKELAVNANKANTKRVYFLDRGLDIDNPEQYKTGMETFKKDTLDNIHYYFRKQKEHGLYIKICFQTRDRHLVISVHNNVLITRKEQIRVFDRIARARAFEAIHEAFSVVLDQSEGAGLGIVVLILMLKKIGLTEDAFELDVENGETIARLNIPFTQVHIEQMDILTQAVVREVETLPRFPENLVYLQKLIADPESKIGEIAHQVSTDPTLTAELLKLVNSPIYRVAQRVDNIQNAVKLVGMKGLRNLLYSYGTQKVLGKKYSQMKELWDHSNKVALFAYAIAKNFVKKNKIIEDVFVGAILHDLGKIIITALHPDLLDKIVRFCMEKGLPREKLENLSMGLNHAETGALIAKKWNFPEQLIAAIRYHHNPSNVEDEFRDIAFTVYIANLICDVQEKKINFDQIVYPVRHYFSLSTEEDFEHFIASVTRIVENESLG